MIKGLLDKLQASVKELEGEESGEGIATVHSSVKVVHFTMKKTCGSIYISQCTCNVLNWHATARLKSSNPISA